MRYNFTMNLEGIFPPVTTPFNSDESLALGRLRENIARYNRTGIAGYVVTGSTGESVLLSRDEADEVWGAAAEAAAPGMTLIAGAGTDSTSETIARTNRAAALGYHFALVKTPYYYKPLINDALLAEHFTRVADAARIPLLIYSVPQFTGVAVEPPLAMRLAAHPNIAGIKESSGNIQRVTEIINGCPARFRTLVGSAPTLYASLAVGAIGGILAAADALPELCVELYQAARAGQAARAKELQHCLLAPAIALTSRYGIPGLKFAMDQLGYYGGPSRRPLLPVTEAAQREIQSALSAVASAAKTA